MLSFCVHDFQPTRALSMTKARRLKESFIDGTVRPIARPTNGQQSMYSGHKRKHGVKFQTLAAPDGMIVHMWGGIEARRHDCTMLARSKLCERLLSEPAFEGYFIYGDPAYGCSENFVCPYPTVMMTKNAKKFNKVMSKLRVCVEWLYGDVVRYWPALDMKTQMKIQQTPIWPSLHRRCIAHQLCYHGSRRKHHV